MDGVHRVRCQSVVFDIQHNESEPPVNLNVFSVPFSHESILGSAGARVTEDYTSCICVLFTFMKVSFLKSVTLGLETITKTQRWSPVSLFGTPALRVERNFVLLLLILLLITITCTKTIWINSVFSLNLGN